MAQVRLVLSGVYRKDKKTLKMLKRLKSGFITANEAWEDFREELKKLFPDIPNPKPEPSLCCLFLLVKIKNSFILQVIGELGKSKINLDFATQEILLLIDDECPAAHGLAIAKAIANLEFRIKLREEIKEAA